MQRTQSQPRPVNMPLPPIMHGTGFLSAIGAMASGGTCLTLASRSCNPEEALDAHSDRYDISSIKVISSSGVMWTWEIKTRLIRHNSEIILSDGFSSSDAIGLGTSIMTKDQEIEVAHFALGPHCKVFTEDLVEVQPGSSEPGMVAVCGNIPIGYYKDQEKTDKTFKVIEGVRYSIPDDEVTVEVDGSLTLLGGAVTASTPLVKRSILKKSKKP